MLALLLVTGLAGLAGADQPAVDPRPIIEKLVEEWVSSQGNQSIKVVGLGSWIKGGAYRNPLEFPADPSDHDMTLVMDSDDPGLMRKKWQEFQGFMQRRLRDKLPQEQAGQVLKSVNIYPPDQLTDDIIDQADAVAKYEALAGKAGGTPNLGGEPVEGLWGGGKKPFVQAYSDTNGRTFYWDAENKTVRQGFSDLDNMMAGYGKFSGYNTARLSSQFADKTAKALTSGNPGEAYKNLKRLDQYLRKSKSMAGLKGSAIANPELAEAIADYDKVLSNTLSEAAEEAKRLGQAFDPKSPAILQKARERWLNKNQKLIDQALEYAQLESQYCRIIASGADDAAMYLKQLKGNRLRRFMSTLRKGMDNARRVGAKGMEVAGKVPWGKVLKLAAALAVAAEVYNLADIYNEKGLDAALKQANLTAITSIFPANVVGQMILEYSQQAGYGLVIKQQGCLDLVAGLYEVKGREATAQGSQIDKLARDYTDAGQVERVVALHARRAASKGLKNESAADVEAAEAVAAGLVAKCAGTVLDAWQRERLRLLGLAMAQKIKLDFKLSRTPLTVNLAAKPAGDEVEVIASCRPAGSRSELVGLLRELGDRIKDLGGRGRQGGLLVNERYVWSVRRQGSGGQWSPWQEVSNRTNRVLLDGERPFFFGWNQDAGFKLAKGQRYEVSLEYVLTERPNPDLDFMAPEVRDHLQELWQRYVFKAAMPLDTSFVKLAIKGPDKLLLGQKGELRAEISGRPEPGAEWQVAWLNPKTGEEVRTGPSLSLIRHNQPGKVIIKAVLYQAQNGGRAKMAQTEHALEFIAPAYLRFSAVDKQSRQPLLGARWSLSGPQSISRGPAASIELAAVMPGIYQVQVRAEGYHGLKGPLTLKAGEHYDKVAPLRKMEQEKKQPPAAQSEPPQTAATTPAPSQEQTEYQRICSCYEKLYLAQWKNRAPKDKALVVSAMVWNPAKKTCSGVYRLPPPHTLVRKDGSVGPRQWTNEVPLNQAKRACQKAEPKPQKPPAASQYRPGANGKCQYQTMGVWEGSAKRAYHAKGAGGAAGVYKLEMPGPGTLRITLGVSGKHQASNSEYGACRYRSAAYVSGAESVVKKGRVRGGRILHRGARLRRGLRFL